MARLTTVGLYLSLDMFLMLTEKSPVHNCKRRFKKKRFKLTSFTFSETQYALIEIHPSAKFRRVWLLSMSTRVNDRCPSPSETCCIGQPFRVGRCRYFSSSLYLERQTFILFAFEGICHVRILQVEHGCQLLASLVSNDRRVFS